MSPTVPPDLDEDHVAVLAGVPDGALDRIGHVGDDLDRPAEIVAAPFGGEHLIVDPAGGHVVDLAEGRRREALVVAEVEIRLRPVLGHVDLAVLEGFIVPGSTFR